MEDSSGKRVYEKSSNRQKQLRRSKWTIRTCKVTVIFSGHTRKVNGKLVDLIIIIFINKLY